MAKKQGNDLKKRNPFVWFLSLLFLIVIVISFVVLPAVSTQFNQTSVYFGSYDGQPIRYSPDNYFGRQVTAIANRAQQQGIAIDNIQIAQQVYSQAFSETLFREAILSIGRDAQLVAQEEAIDRVMAQYPIFQENGVFSEERYRQYSATGKQNLRRIAGDDLVYSKVYLDLIGSLPPSESEKEWLSQAYGLNRTLEYVEFAYDQFPLARVKEYADENADLFVSRDLSTLTVASEERAQELIQLIQDETDTFENLAQTESTDRYRSESGARGRTYFYQLRTELGQEQDLAAIFSAEENELLMYEVVGGYQIIRVNGQTLDYSFDDEEVQSTARSYITANERGLLQDYSEEQAASFASAATQSGFAQAASAFDAEVMTTADFPLNYESLQGFATVRDSENQAISDAANRLQFFEQAFGTEIESVSEPVLLQDRIVVLRPTSETPLEESRLEFYKRTAQDLIPRMQNTSIEDAVLDEDKIDNQFTSGFRTLMGI